jgi:hypothetical protein
MVCFTNNHSGNVLKTKVNSQLEPNAEAQVKGKVAL